MTCGLLALIAPRNVRWQNTWAYRNYLEQFFVLRARLPAGKCTAAWPLPLNVPSNSSDIQSDYMLVLDKKTFSEEDSTWLKILRNFCSFGFGRKCMEDVINDEADCLIAHLAEKCKGKDTVNIKVCHFVTIFCNSSTRKMCQRIPL